MASPDQYQFVSEIENDKACSLLPDVAYHPTRPLFLVTLRDNHEIRVYNADTLQRVKTLSNPEARLFWPHGLVSSENHFVVSNRYNLEDQQVSLSVYKHDDTSGAPVQVFVTPLPHLRDTHSMDIHEDKLVVTYYAGGRGALVAYHFDDESGTISGPISVVEDYFSKNGEPKGVSFTSDGKHLLVSFVSEKSQNWYTRIRKLHRVLVKERDIPRFVAICTGKSRRKFRAEQPQAVVRKTLTNGLALFPLDEKGHLRQHPTSELIREQFCRLENIHIAQDTCVISDPVNGNVELYRLQEQKIPKVPFQVLHEHLSFPHDACLSPDSKQLVVSNYGIEVANGRPLWGSYVEPRSDTISVFKVSDNQAV
ncbi:MAG: YncE family protein [bacterium]